MEAMTEYEEFLKVLTRMGVIYVISPSSLQGVHYLTVMFNATQEGSMEFTFLKHTGKWVSSYSSSYDLDDR